MALLEASISSTEKIKKKPEHALTCEGMKMRLQSIASLVAVHGEMQRRALQLVSQSELEAEVRREEMRKTLTHEPMLDLHLVVTLRHIRRQQ